MCCVSKRGSVNPFTRRVHYSYHLKKQLECTAVRNSYHLGARSAKSTSISCPIGGFFFISAWKRTLRTDEGLNCFFVGSKQASIDWLSSTLFSLHSKMSDGNFLHFFDIKLHYFLKFVCGGRGERGEHLDQEPEGRLYVESEARPGPNPTLSRNQLRGLGGCSIDPPPPPSVS